jgi:hypothetical protein
MRGAGDPSWPEDGSDVEEKHVPEAHFAAQAGAGLRIAVLWDFRCGGDGALGRYSLAEGIQGGKISATFA